VHGVSIGGIPACHLAGKNLVNFCFADRTFSNLEALILNLKYGKYLMKLYKFFMYPCQSTTNTDSYINVTYCQFY